MVSCELENEAKGFQWLAEMSCEQVWEEVLEDFVFVVLDGDFLVFALWCGAEEFNGFAVFEWERSVVI